MKSVNFMHTVGSLLHSSVLEYFRMTGLKPRMLQRWEEQMVEKGKWLSHQKVRYDVWFGSNFTLLVNKSLLFKAIVIN